MFWSENFVDGLIGYFSINEWGFICHVELHKVFQSTLETCGLLKKNSLMEKLILKSYAKINYLF